MKYNISFSLISLLLILTSAGYAQDMTLYNMRHLPQYSKDNIAKQPDCNVYVEIPGAGSIYTNVYHTGFTFNDFIASDPNRQDSFMIDLDGLEAAMAKKNFLNINNDVGILEFGFRLPQRFYFTFGITNKTSFSFMYPRSIIEARRGNYREDGTPLNFMFGLSARNYMETSFGLSKELYNNMTVGARLKFLSGYADISANNIGFDWYTDADGYYDYTFVTDFEIHTANIAGGADVSDLSAGDTAAFNDFLEEFSENIDDFFLEQEDGLTLGVMDILLGQNKGFAIDLGYNYKFNRYFTFSAAVNDLGFIKWKSNPIQAKHSGEFVFSGVDVGKYLTDLSQITEGEALSDDFTTDMQDSLINFLTEAEFTNTTYKTALSTTLYAGAQYTPVKWFDLGLTYRGMLINKTLLSAATLSANTHFLKGWGFTLSYTAMDRQYNNIGLGFVSKLGPLQFYFVSDNIAVPFWSLNGSKLADNWIRNTKRITFHTGFSVTICGGNTDIPLLD